MTKIQCERVTLPSLQRTPFGLSSCFLSSRSVFAQDFFSSVMEHFCYCESLTARQKIHNHVQLEFSLSYTWEVFSNRVLPSTSSRKRREMAFACIVIGTCVMSLISNNGRCPISDPENFIQQPAVSDGSITQHCMTAHLTIKMLYLLVTKFYISIWLCSMSLVLVKLLHSLYCLN